MREGDRRALLRQAQHVREGDVIRDVDIAEYGDKWVQVETIIVCPIEYGDVYLFHPRTAAWGYDPSEYVEVQE